MKLLYDNATVYLAGEEFTVTYQQQKMMKPRVLQSKNIIKVYEGETIKKSHRDILLEWVQSYAVEYIAKRSAVLAKQMELSFNKLTIRDQRSRWGSCSSRKNLNFNYRLIFTPKEVIDYVIVHELSHLKEMNHSKQFWSLVETYMPEYKVWDKWLQVEGKKLF